MEGRGKDVEHGEKDKAGKRRCFIKRHPFLTAVLFSFILGVLLALTVQTGMVGIYKDIVRDGVLEAMAELFGAILSGAVIYGGFMILPLVLTGAEIYLLVKGRKDQEVHQKGRIFDMTGMVLGVLYSLIYLSLFHEVSFGSDWQEQLVNRQTHTPIFTGAQLTVIAIVFLAVAGYLAVNCIPLEKMPPLALVLGLAAMYLGAAESVVWGIQVFRGEVFDLLLLLLPLNCLLLTARTVSHKMWEWDQMMEADETRRNRYREGGGLLQVCNRFLTSSRCWPLAAFLLMWPLLGILIGILVLFGQSPDAVIRAFTETSDWNLSQQTAPQNIYYDEHYLCTVAAGGHKKVVKPQRLGVRHGHPVIVNRQLCVANAFEQVLEERIPRFHRGVRYVYDTYGFPVAKRIRSKYTADLVYLVMKPLEWLFLTVLYLTDANPENRIALQYTGKGLKDFNHQP